MNITYYNLLVITQNLVSYIQTWGQLGYDSQIFSCTVKDLYDKNPLTTFLAIGNGIPLIIISYCYVSVYCKVKKTHNDLQDIMDGDVVDSNLSRQMAEREAAITKMTLMVCTYHFLEPFQSLNQN